MIPHCFPNLSSWNYPDSGLEGIVYPETTSEQCESSLDFHAKSLVHCSLTSKSFLAPRRGWSQPPVKRGWGGGRGAASMFPSFICWWNVDSLFRVQVPGFDFPDRLDAEVLRCASEVQSSSLTSGSLGDLRKAPALPFTSTLLFAKQGDWISCSQTITVCDVSWVQMF